MTNTGISVFLNGEEIKTGHCYLHCKDTRRQFFGMKPGEGPKEALEMSLALTDCHTNLSDGTVTVKFFGVEFSAFARTCRQENIPHATFTLYDYELLLGAPK
ncbi:hypothetical protein 13VV501A_gene0013 [Vibrio phage 13VV501A]|nr:hypothetical protein 13VV501A_gene0013 [Vibrio phage 13VV501A]